MKDNITEKTIFLGHLSERRGFHLILLLTVSIIIVFYNLGQNSFHNGDEATHALMVKDMLSTGDWITLKIEGENAFVKPPFMIWLGVLSSLAFGFSEFSVRFPSAVFGVLTILFTFLLAERLFNRKAALLSALMMLTCTQFIYVHSSKTAEFDSAITFFVLLSAYLMWMSQWKKNFFYIAFASIGIVAMIKNMVFVMPMGVLVLYLLLSGRIKTFSLKEWAVGFGIFLLIAFPWHIGQLIIHGRAFLDLYFFDQMIGRRVGAGIPIGISNPFFFIEVILRGFFPWSIIIPFAAATNILYMKKGYKEATILLFVWAFVVLLICNMITAKHNSQILQSWYILPIYPAFAVLNGRFLSEFLTGLSNKKFLSLSLVAIIILFIIITPDLHYNPFEKQSFKSLMKLNLNGAFLSFYHKSIVITLVTLIIAWFILSLITYLILKRGDKRFLGASKVLSYAIFSYIIVVSFVVTIKPLWFSNHKSDFDRMNKKIWSNAYPETVLVLYDNNLPFYQHYLYFHNFNDPRRITVKFIGVDDNLLFQEVSSSEKSLFLLGRQHYFDIRIKDKFKAILPQPITEFTNYILLGKSGRTHPKEDRRALTLSAINILKDNNSQIRKEEARSLGRQGDTRVASSLIDLLDDPDDTVVSAAARALSDLRYPGAIDPLKRALTRYGEDDKTYQTIALALAYLRNKSSIDFLVKKYRGNPIYRIKEPGIINPPEYSDHDNFWTAYLLLDIDPFVARDVIFDNLVDYVNDLQNRGIRLSTYNRMLYSLYRLDNKIALNLIEELLDDKDISRKRIALYLLAKPTAVITKLTEKEMDRAQSLLGKVVEGDHSPETRTLAREILQRYHRDAWVGW